MARAAICRRMHSTGVRYAVFGCGNSDWARDLSVDPAPHRRATGGAWRAAASILRGEGDARDDLDGQFESWFAKLRPCAVKEFGIDYEFRPQCRRRAAVQDRAGCADRRQCGRCPRRRRADEGAGQHRTAKQERRQCLGAVDPAHRGATAFRHQLPGRRSPQRSAAQRSGAGGFGGAPLRIPAGRPDPAAGRRRPPRAIAGRRYRFGGAVAE